VIELIDKSRLYFFIFFLLQLPKLVFVLFNLEKRIYKSNKKLKEFTVNFNKKKIVFRKNIRANFNKKK